MKETQSRAEPSRDPSPRLTREREREAQTRYSQTHLSISLSCPFLILLSYLHLPQINLSHKIKPIQRPTINSTFFFFLVLASLSLFASLHFPLPSDLSLFLRGSKGMEAAFSSPVEFSYLSRTWLTCAWEAFVSGTLLFSAALVKSQLLPLAMLLAEQQISRGDSCMECYSHVKPMDAEGDDDEGDEDDDPEGDGEFGEGEEELSSDGGEDYGANPNNNNGNTKKGGALGGSGGAEENGEDEDDEEEDGENPEEDDDDDDDDDEDDDGGEEEEVVEEEEEDEEEEEEEEDEDEEALQPPKKRKK